MLKDLIAVPKSRERCGGDDPGVRYLDLNRVSEGSLMRFYFHNNFNILKLNGNNIIEII